MPSSTSSSELRLDDAPPYVRPVPALAFRTAGLIAVAVFVLGLALWEKHWRDFGAPAVTVSSDVLWALQRERIDKGEGDATVIVGSSRVLFGVQPEVWERLDGRRPIQLALEGTSAVPVLEHLAKDTAFTGRLLIGVTPPLFFSGFAFRESAIRKFDDLTLTDRSGQWLAMHLLEPRFAFLDPDFALFTVLKRQDWPARDGVRVNKSVRRLSDGGPDRTTRMWAKVEQDTAYRNLARRIWAQNFAPPPGVTPQMVEEGGRTQIRRAKAAIETLRARGVRMVFVRMPSSGDYLAAENAGFPRAKTWDVLLAETGVPGVHFEDHPELQGYDIPEWSHLTASEADRFTAALHQVVARVAPAVVRRGGS